MLLKDQNDISAKRAMPVDLMNNSASISSISGETVQFYYYNTSTHVLTSDAGQAAGVAVIGKVATAPVYDGMGTKVGNKGNSSLAFTCLALLVERPFPQIGLEQSLETDAYILLANVTKGFANGEYCIDYRTGTIYAVKATTASTMTSVSYKVPASSISLATGDVEIGAVEIKNGSSDDRAVVATADADGVSNTQNELQVTSRLAGFNATSWDRLRAGLKTVQTALTGFLNTLPFGIYNATRPVAADGNGLPNQIDTEGKQIVLPYSRPADMVSGSTAAMTGTTSTELLAAPATGLRNYVTQILITNSHATVNTFVTIRDGSGGTVLYQGYAAALGGGFAISFPTPLRQPTTATALHVKDETTGANVIANASGYVGA